MRSSHRIATPDRRLSSVAWRASLPILAVLLLAFAAFARGGRRRIGRLVLHPCLSRATRELARCGIILLPENRALPTGRAVALHVLVLPARDQAARREPIVFLDGGPGLPATQDAAYASWALGPLRDTHDLVLVDMRGTGGDRPLVCHFHDDGGRVQPYLEPMFPLAGVRRCAARLARRADLTRYTSEAAARDLDAVRAALHIARWDLYGASYGTRLAFEYMRLFPARVRRAALLGVLPPEAPIGRDFAVGGERAMDSAFAACAADARCRTAMPDPRGDVRTLLARLRRAPATVTLWNWRRVGRERVTLTAHAAAELLWFDAYDPGTLARVLRLVHRAVTTGDASPLVRQFVAASRARRDRQHDGVLLSVLCAEDVPRLGGVAAADDTLLLGDPVVPELDAACRVWPHAAVDPRFGDRVRTAIPTLLISGDRDPASPAFLADSAATALSRGERYVDGEGHAELDDRSRARLAAFLGVAEP